MTVKMYPGMFFDYYILDDLPAGLKEDGKGGGILDKSELPKFKVRVLNHRQTMEMLDMVDLMEKLQDEVEAGDHLKVKDVTDIQIDLIKKHVTDCENFPKTEAGSGGKFDVEKVDEILTSRQIAFLAKAVIDQRSNDHIELEDKKKLSSPSEASTEGAPDEIAPDTENAETSQP